MEKITKEIHILFIISFSVYVKKKKINDLLKVQSLARPIVKNKVRRKSNK